jgi:pimeloyl-ACP methyl ester carboxylesterase
MSKSSTTMAIAFVAVVALVSCSGDERGSTAAGRSDSSRPSTTRERRPLPKPVTVVSEPQGIGLADPAFTALPGAQAEYGRLGGSVYQVEMPDDWNGRLVLWMHGWEEFDSEASVSAPDLRAYLIARGDAWAASSYSTTGWSPRTNVDETAALWDRVARQYGRPSFTYVIGLSLGGAAGHIAAEVYPDRFDGVLALSGSAGATPGLRDSAAQFVAAAYLAGVTQAEYDATRDVNTLIEQRIRPALTDPELHDQFVELAVELSGGPRPFGREGFRIEEDTFWSRTALSVGAGVVPPHDQPYELGPTSSVSSADFNRDAIRLRTDPELLRAFTDRNEITGDLAVPLITMHTTGDGQVPISQALIVRQRAEASHRGGLLVQRVIRDPGHVGFNVLEWRAGFEALTGWVEHGTKPRGNDVMTGDFTHLRNTFEHLPRDGTPEALAVPGTEDTAVVRVRILVDGAPAESRFMGAYVTRDGLSSPCGLSSERGRIHMVSVAAHRTIDGCGAAGTKVLFWIAGDSGRLFAIEELPWPGGGTTVDYTARFSTADPNGVSTPTTGFVGEVIGPDGNYARPGTRVEARIGDTLCGVSSTRRTGSFSGYILTVVGPEAIAGCREGAPITFHALGATTLQTEPNALGDQTPLDLIFSGVGDHEAE